MYKRQIRRYAEFASRIHIDLSDGKFTPTKLTPIDEVWWPGNVQADVHVMFKRPFEYVKTFVAMHPQIVIVHAEAEGDLADFAQVLHKVGIQVGLALLPKTSAESILSKLEHVDHVLIFGGKLGFQGGKADLKNLKKVPLLKQHKPELEISWDGGVNDKNIGKLIEGGVDVLNAGGFIGSAVNPLAAYVTLETLAQSAEKRLNQKASKKRDGHEHRRFRTKS